MKSTTRNLIIVAGVIAVLGGAVAALTLNKTPVEESESSLVDNSIHLVSKQLEDIVSMRVDNSEGGYTIIPTTQKAESTAASESSAAADKTVYVVEELKDLPQYNSAAERILQDGFSLIASKNVGEVSDLSEYGLDKPAATIQVKFKDDTTFDYNIGNASAGDSSSYYMCPKDSENVYVVSIDDRLFKGAGEFVQRKLVDAADPTGQSQPVFGDIKLSGTSFELPITLTMDVVNKYYTVTEQGKGPVRADDTAYSNLATALTSVTADSVAYIFPDAETLKKCGLDNPAAVVDFIVNEQSYKLSVGGALEKQRYIMIEGMDVIFLIDQEDVKTWSETSAYTLRTKFVNLFNIVDMRELNVTAGDTVYSFVQTRTKNEEESTEDNVVYDYKVTCNGTEITYEPNFKKFYTNIIATQIIEQSDQTPEGDPKVTVTFKYYDEAKHDDVIKYYAADNRRYLVTLNDDVQGLVTQKAVEDVIIISAEKMSRDELVTAAI